MRFLWLAMLVGCVSADVVLCADGVTTCPGGNECVALPERTYCASPDELAACTGVAEGGACLTGEGVCHSTICIPAECGNQLSDPGEMCDDGNTSSRDGCSADCLTTEVCRNGVIDAAFGEQCDDGNGDNHDGCSSSCIEEAATWIPRGEDRPDLRLEARLAFDSKRNRVVMFGGYRPGIFEVESEVTLEWDGVRWTTATTVVRPQPRSEPQMAFDALHGQTVLFSGDHLLADTWLWDGLRWSITNPATSPPARQAGGMVYDSKRDRIILFGGRQPSGDVGDMWQWSGTTWQALTPTTMPPARSQAHMVYDPKRDRIVLFGGAGKSDLWEFDGTNWAPITFSSGPGVQAGGGAAFDPVTNHVILIVNESSIASAVWDWDGTSWTRRSTAFPDSLGGQVITTDFTRGRVVVWNFGFGYVGLYELDGSTWQAPQGSTALPPSNVARWLGAFVLDPVRRTTIGFGGASFNGTTILSDTVVYDGAWNTVTGAGTPPSARYGAGAAFDVARKQMVLFGGCTSGPYAGETYTFDTAWQLKAPLITPDPRCVPAMAYDAARQQIVMFGGLGTTQQGNTVAFADTWIWNGSTWTVESPPVSPPALFGATMAYDEVREQLVLFGGHDQAGNISDETWLWDGAAKTWTKQTTPIAPPRRYLSALAWDYARRRLVLMGGLDDLVNPPRSLADVWEWDGAAWSQIETLPRPALDGHAMVPGLDGGVVVIGGQQTGVGLDFQAVWLLRHDGQSRYETCTNIDVDGDGLAGCADSDCDPLCVLCGDGVCDPTVDTCASCQEDCGACSPTCGDELCQSGEVCAADC